MLDIFFIQQFYRKKYYFTRRPREIILRDTFEHFLGKRGILPKKLTSHFFYYKLGTEYVIN